MPRPLDGYYLGTAIPQHPSVDAMPVGDAVSFQQLRKSSITVVRHMLASMKTRGEKSGEFFLPDLNLHYEPAKPSGRLE